jgi:metalloendopeptidase OMA1, mitochondrial
MEITRRQALGQLVVAGAAYCCCGCRTTPMTGRKQLLLVPEQQEIAMGLSAYEETTKKEKPSDNRQYVALVNRVGERIAKVADRPDYKWEFRAIASETQNAFCLPGGKVAVYEGIMPVCANESGLAVVMSHEIAHALARHGGERMSQNYAVDGVRKVVDYAMQKREEHNRELVMQAYGAASKYGVILPYSRKHESEADHMGILLMAKAGYDPAEAPRFWQRFSTMNQGQQPAEFLSTHPSDERRAKDLLALVPKAGELYQAAPAKYGVGEPVLVAAAPPLAAPGAIPASTAGFVGGPPLRN